MKKFCLVLLLTLGSSGLWAQASAPPSKPLAGGLDVAAERSRISAERQQVEARFKAEETACYQKFAVNDCINASRVVRREKLADLRRQEISLNDAERKRKGAEQIQRMEDKQKDQVPPQPMHQRERGKPANPGQAGQTGEQAPREASAPKVPKPRTPHVPVVKDPAVAAAEAAQERERYERKLEEAAAHKAQLAKRNAERTKPRAQPLPPAP
ncbi:hypothetical protein RD110_08980 [Rhodoferax koreense]|uniref:Uncharacterized protein n=1 Tax=Rhodoferax koreensis TaxID=1842727 RepID=A0A1P8JU61_9BURK|nr:hypothetical protein [Rhodoferax koreense]APW37310.1 hypothetical protein RD110_08980 [Rhodoferax koreense]